MMMQSASASPGPVSAAYNTPWHPSASMSPRNGPISSSRRRSSLKQSAPMTPYMGSSHQLPQNFVPSPQGAGGPQSSFSRPPDATSLPYVSAQHMSPSNYRTSSPPMMSYSSPHQRPVRMYSNPWVGPSPYANPSWMPPLEDNNVNPTETQVVGPVKRPAGQKGDIELDQEVIKTVLEKGKWIYGSQYLPSLHVRLIDILRPTISIHPTLQTAALQWDMTSHSRSLTSILQEHYNNNTTYPPLRHMRILSRSFPWCIEIYPRTFHLQFRQDVVFGDLLEGVSEFFQEHLLATEMDNVPRKHWEMMSRAYLKKTKNSPSPPPEQGSGDDEEQEEESPWKGMLRRGDWLCEKTMFAGLERDPEYVKERLGCDDLHAFVIVCRRKTDEDAGTETPDFRNMSSMYSPPTEGPSSTYEGDELGSVDVNGSVLGPEGMTREKESTTETRVPPATPWTGKQQSLPSEDGKESINGNGTLETPSTPWTGKLQSLPLEDSS